MREVLHRIEKYMAIAAKNTLDTEEAAMYLGLTSEALRNKVATIPHYKGENGRNYFKKEELDKYKCAVCVMTIEERDDIARNWRQGRR